MSSKRQATTDLNHDNWDRIEEPEERGNFRAAPDDVLKTRVIRKAARRVKLNESTSVNSDGKINPFSSFAGFQKANAASSFSFLDKIIPTTATQQCHKGSTKNITDSNSGILRIDGSSSINDNKHSEGQKLDYFAKLKALNMAVSCCIRTHIDQNPICILTPIFEDYKKYLNEMKLHNISIVTPSIIKDKRTAAEPIKCNDVDLSRLNYLKDPVTTDISTTSQNISGSGTSKVNNFAKAISSQKPINIFSGFKFERDELKYNSKDICGISDSFDPTSSNYGTRNSCSSMEQYDLKPKSFSFNASHSFENCKPVENCIITADSQDKSDEDDEVPKVQFKQVVEENAIYSRKCKAFIKKENEFVDCGVGTLYLKPVKNGEKMQLLMRADTNLGNIQANFLLSSATPAKRLGKNNVMIMCLPTPDYSKPTALLLRVKTSEEADELLEMIKKHEK